MKTVRKVSISILVLVSLMGISFYALNEENLTLDENSRALLNSDFRKLQHGHVHYQLTGEAKKGTVVLVHGFSIPSYIWDKNVSALVSAGYQVLRFDLYGRGYSDRPDINYDIDLFVDQLRELSEALSLPSPFHLVGLSMGGPVTTRFSHQNPDKVKSLTLLAPLVNTPERLDLKLLGLPFLGEYLSGVVMMPRLANSLENTVYEAKSYPEWYERLEEHRHFKGYRRALLSTIRYLSGKSFIADYHAFGQTGIPSQLIWGQNDEVVDYGQRLSVKDAVPGITFYSLEKTGHLPQIEQKESVNHMLIRFLDAH